MTNRKIIFLFLSLIFILTAFSQNGMTYWYRLKTDSLWVQNGATIDSALVINGDVTISGSVSAGEVTFDSLIVDTWFDIHNGVVDTFKISTVIDTLVSAKATIANAIIAESTIDSISGSCDIDTISTIRIDVTDIDADSANINHLIVTSQVEADSGNFNHLVVNTDVGSDLTPQATGAYDLGTGALSWGNAFIDSVLTVLIVDADSVNAENFVSNTWTDIHNGVFDTLYGENGELITNGTDGTWSFGTAKLATTGSERGASEYEFIFDVSNRTGGIFPDGAAYKTYIYNTEVDREDTEDATGDSRDVMFKGVYRNYGQNANTHNVQGIGTSVRNESAGTLGSMKGGEFAVSNKSGGTVNNQLYGLTSTVENYGTPGTDIIGGRFDLRNEGTNATNEWGIHITNTNNSQADAADAAIYVDDTGANIGWGYGIDMSGATIQTAEIIGANSEIIFNDPDGVWSIGDANLLTTGDIAGDSITGDHVISADFVGPLTGNATTSSDVDTTGTDIAAALADRQDLCTTLTQLCACLDSVTCVTDTVSFWKASKESRLIFTSP